MKYFENFVRFFKPDWQNRLLNYFEPREAMKEPLIAVIGDKWRFLVPKSDIGNNKLSELKVELWGDISETCVPEYGVVKRNIAYIRRQQSELYYDMVIKINNSPSDIWKQFSLVSENGKELFGTFQSQTTNFDDYCEELKEWFEAYPHTRVDCYRDGNLLYIHAWENGNFKIKNEKIIVSLGKSNVLNTNTPTLTKVFAETYTRAAYYEYDLVIGNDITAGNVFSYETVVYTVTSADTPTTIKKQLLGTQNKIRYDEGDSILLNVSVGVTRTVNTNTPLITLLFDHTHAGNDYYKITVSNIQKGNIFQVLISTELPIFVNVSESDTISTVEALLNPDSGFLVVSYGSTVTVNAAAGIREDANTNNPSIYTENGIFYPSASVDKYKVFVGTSVRQGNIFTLNDVSVVADDSDTYITISQKLNLIDGLYFESANDFNCFAQKGLLYNDKNIANVEIISSPIKRIAEQYLCEIDFLGISTGKVYQIAINKYNNVNGDFDSIVAYSNYIKVEPTAKDTVMLRYSDNGKVFGSDYYENGIYQQIRIPLFFKNEKTETTQVLRQSVNDATIKGQIEIRKKHDFQIPAFGSWFHRSLQIALNSKKVFLNNKKYSLVEYSESDDIGAKKIKTGIGVFYEQDYLMKNYGGLWLDESNYLERISIKTSFNEKIICIVIYNDYFRKEITESGEVFLPVGEYHWKVLVTGAKGELSEMIIYKNGQLIENPVLIGYRWNKTENSIRCESGDCLIFEEVVTDSLIEYLTTNIESNIIEDSIDYVDENSTNMQPEYNINMLRPGKWRRRVDENGYYIEVYNSSNEWEIKHVLM